MQGISSAPMASGMVASTASADAMAGGGGAEDVTAGSGSLFGAILAGQLKGRSVGGNGMDLAALVADINRRHGDVTERTDEILPTQDILGDLLAAAGINVAAFMPPQASGIAVSGEAHDSLSLEADGLVVEGEELPAGVNDLTADGKKLPVADDTDTKTARFTIDQPHNAEQDKDGDQLSARSSGLPRGEDFAAGGKNLSASEASIQPAGSLDHQKIFLDTPPIAGNAQTANVIPAAMPTIQASSGPLQTAAMEISVPVNSPAWGESLGNKMVWMSGQGSQVAELRLDPPHLGPLEVRLTMNNDQASVSFVSHHPAVREAIESAMPRLREMLADNGIMLGNTSVGAESFQQQQQASAENARNGRGNGAQDEGDMLDMSEVASGQMLTSGGSGKGLVDMFV